MDKVLSLDLLKEEEKTVDSSLEQYILDKIEERKPDEVEKMNYSKEFKEEAIRLSDEIGNKKAAAQLGIPYYTLADWRNHSKHKPKGTKPMSEE